VVTGAEEGLDELYAAPLDEFTSRRNALAKGLATAGEKERAAEIKALVKPNAVAWALNQLARTDQDEISDLLGTAETLRGIQRGETGDLRAANAKVRDHVTKLLGRALGILEANDKQATQAVKNRLLQSLMAAAADEQAGVLLRAGRLSRELEPGGFDPTGGDRFVSAERDERTSQRQQEAEARVNSLIEEAEDAERLAKQLAEEAARAERAADRARAAAREAAATAEAKRARALSAQSALEA
jgi:hypothetical protein